MSFSIAYRLALATAVVFGVLASIGTYSFFEAYLSAAAEVAATGVIVENWSLFVTEFLLNIAGLCLSIIGFFGGVYGPRSYRHICIFTFAFGVVCVIVLRWIAVLFGVLNFHGAVSVVPALVGITWFGLLSVALWPNYSLKRTAAGRLQ